MTTKPRAVEPARQLEAQVLLISQALADFVRELKIEVIPENMRPVIDRICQAMPH
jgi:hypothetical protein